MKAILGIAVAVILLLAAGWITWRPGDSRSSIDIETERIEQDLDRVGDAAKGLVDDARRELDDGTEPQ
ncbi:MAG TPA: hypothetical protein DCQ98_20555 [Planctomycetaceae bacterium]|nr:hypothetical protein [Planctomycetaceae bacterium]HRE98981.1 hypothetical protein [Pirellulaceae bacterium]